MSDVQVEITIQRSGVPDRVVTLRQGVAHVGRTEDNEVPLPDPGVSRRHVRLQVARDAVHVEDLGSGNGTYFRGGRVQRVDLRDGDQLYVDPFTLIFRFSSAPAEAPRRASRPRTPLRPARLVTLAGARVDAEYPLKTETVTLGRSNQREIVLYDPGASRLQAEVVWKDDGWWLVDGASANGTYLNGERVNTQRLQTGDRVRIGATEFRFEEGADGPAPRPAPPPPAPSAPKMPVLPPPVPSGPTLVGAPTRSEAPAGPAVSTAPVATPTPGPAPSAKAPAPPVAAPSAAPAAGPRPPDAPPARKAPAPKRSSSPARRLVVAGLALFALLCLASSALLFWLALRPQALDALVHRAPPPLAAEPPPSPEITEGLAAGRALFDQGRYIDALGRFYQVRKLAPNHPDANRMIYLSSEFLVLSAMRDELIKRSTPPAEQQASLQRALAAAEAAVAGKGDAVAARAALERALIFFPGHPKATEALARLGPAPTR